jgi:hypothetical protein
MMQIGEIPPVPAVPNGLPVDSGPQTKPQSGPQFRPEPDPTEGDDREVFVSPPPAPWPRVFPGL